MLPRIDQAELIPMRKGGDRRPASPEAVEAEVVVDLYMPISVERADRAAGDGSKSLRGEPLPARLQSEAEQVRAEPGARRGRQTIP